MQPHDGGFWRWTRLNLFDGWQVLGTIGLLAGVFVFSIMLAQTKHVLPSTGSAFQLVQTLVTDRPTPEPSSEPSPQASPTPASVNTGTAVIQKPSASRSGVSRTKRSISSATGSGLSGRRSWRNTARAAGSMIVSLPFVAEGAVRAM